MQNKNRILFILHIPPPVHGSAIVGEQIKNSAVINNNLISRYINLGTSNTIDEIGKKGIDKYFRYFSILIQVVKQLIIFRPNLCYLAITAKGPAFYKDAIVALLVKLFGVKIVYHFHNKGVSKKQHKAPDNFLYRKVFKNTNAILLSKHLYADVEKYFNPEHVYYCPNGIPDVAYKQTRIDKTHRDTVEILFLSNLIESKGLFVLLEACKILHEKQLPFHCTFVGGVGDATPAQFQMKVRELDLQNKIVYAGKKYGKEKEEVFVNADIFVHPTFEDCFPIVLLEAMQYSLPAISTFEGGIADIIADSKTGFLVPPKDAIILANKLKILIKNPELRIRMGQAARSRYENEFTLNVFEERLKEILNNLVHGK